MPSDYNSPGYTEEVIDEARYKRVQTQRRVLLVMLALALVGLILFIVAVCTSQWVQVDLVRPTFKVTIWLGIWGEWRRDYNLTDSADYWIAHFPDPPDQFHRLSDFDLPHYYRAQAAISCIAVVLKIASLVVGYYSLQHFRYVFKRLAAGLFLIAGMCVLVVIQVLVNAIDEWKGDREGVESKYEDESDEYFEHDSYAYSIILAYIDFAIFILAAIVFAWCSRKHKGDNAATGEYEFEDRPMNLGR